jgi:hypothetical protein
VFFTYKFFSYLCFLLHKSRIKYFGLGLGPFFNIEKPEIPIILVAILGSPQEAPLQWGLPVGFLGASWCQSSCDSNNSRITHVNSATPPRTPKISGLKSQILKPTF